MAPIKETGSTQLQTEGHICETAHPAQMWVTFPDEDKFLDEANSLSPWDLVMSPEV